MAKKVKVEPTREFVNNLSENSARKILIQIIKKLNEDDLYDFFGTEGWRHRYGFEKTIAG